VVGREVALQLCPRAAVGERAAVVAALRGAVAAADAQLVPLTLQTIAPIAEVPGWRPTASP
jgi:hypothetical protein